MTPGTASGSTDGATEAPPGLLEEAAAEAVLGANPFVGLSVPQSGSLMITSCATSTRRRVR